MDDPGIVLVLGLCSSVQAAILQSDVISVVLELSTRVQVKESLFLPGVASRYTNHKIDLTLNCILLLRLLSHLKKSAFDVRAPYEPFLCVDAYDSDPNLVTYPLRSTVSRKVQKLDNLVKDTAQSQKIAFSTRTQSKVTLSRPTPDRDPTPTYHSIDNPACHKHNSLDSVSTDASSPSVECLDC
uniref:Uncharacterized protein n=1 Tax=Timema bartmani TaxID=61472 RepID=A0A7R9F2C1_9NEOP|nr:unnamed protein product [Timema bartmani]